MATVAKTSITADTSAVVDGQAIDAGDVVVPIEDNRDNIREGRVAAIGTATHVGTLDDVLKVTAPMTKTVNNPSGDADVTLDVDDMVGATGVAAGAAGLVPEPAAGDEAKFLRGDATWGAAAGGGTVTSVDVGTGLVTNTGSPITASGTIYPNLPQINGVRLSLQNNVAIPTSDQSGAASIYVVPHLHNQIAVYDGSKWEILTATGSTSFSLVALSASTLYDVFAYDNTGLDLEFVAWTSSGFGSSSRATALTTQDGAPVKSGDATRRYLGTIYINSSGGQSDDTALKRYLWNAQNRVARKLRVQDATNSWTYSSAAWRKLNNSVANRVEFVCGQLLDPVKLLHQNYVTNTFGTVGIDLNSDTDGSDGTEFTYGANTATALSMFNDYAAVGLNYLQLMEYGAAGGPTFQGDSGTTHLQTGASGEVYA